MNNIMSSEEEKKRLLISKLNNQKNKYNNVKPSVQPVVDKLTDVESKLKDTDALSGIDEISKILIEIENLKDSVNGITKIIDDAVSKIDSEINSKDVSLK